MKRVLLQNWIIPVLLLLACFLVVITYFDSSVNHLTWSIDLGDIGYFTPVVSPDGTIYVCGDTAMLYAIDPDGNMLWEYPGVSDNRIPNVGADGTVYVGGSKGLSAINPDGSLKWLYTMDRAVYTLTVDANGVIYITGDTYETEDTLYAISPEGNLLRSFPWYGASLVIGDDGTLYSEGGLHVGTVFAYDPEGNEKWVYSTGDHSYSPPVIGRDGTIYTYSILECSFYAINPDGSLKWSLDNGSGIFSKPAIGADGTVYVGGVKLHAIDPDGNLIWTCDEGPFVYNVVIGSEGTMYVGNALNLSAISPDGILLWSATPRGHGLIYHSVGEDGTIYAASREGRLFAFEP